MKYKRHFYIGSWIVGLVIIILGLHSLHDIFARESQNARADLAARRKALDQYALKALQQNLHNRLKFAQFNIEQVTHDPLVPDRGLIMIHRGEQILPRPVQHLQQSHNPAMELYHWVLDIDPLDLVIENASPWDQRLNLLSNFKLAIDNGDNEEIRWGFRAIREHRTRAEVGPEKDIPFMLAVVDYFIRESHPSNRMLQGVLRDGSIVEQERNVRGLQRRLLQHRNRFTRADFEFLRDRIVALSKHVQVNYQDFLQQSDLPVRDIHIGNINNPAIGFSGAWYVEPVGGEEVLGIAIDFDQVIREISQEMTLLGLIRTTDRITIANNNTSFTEINQLELTIKSEIWREKDSDITALYWLKTSLLTASALLIIVIMGLTGIIYYRKNRLLTLKSDFISTVSHELKTPLASLRLLAETMDRKGINSEKIRDYPTRIVKTIDDLNLLVENILSFNRLSKGDWESKFEAVDIKECLLDVSYEFKRHSHIARDNQLSLDIESGHNSTHRIKADPALIKILFRNLLSNSIKYNTENICSISIKTDASERYNIYYHDNGIGIADDKWQDVFVEFTRITDGRMSVPGTGLGLSICRKIMELHNGSIDIVPSDRPGTCFKLSFPAI